MAAGTLYITGDKSADALLNRDGTAVASSDPLDVGLDHRAQPYFLDALQSNATLFSTSWILVQTCMSRP